MTTSIEITPNDEQPLSLIEAIDCDDRIEKLKPWWNGAECLLAEMAFAAWRVTLQAKAENSIVPYRIEAVLREMEERGEKYFGIPSYTYLRPNAQSEKHGDCPGLIWSL